MGKGNERLVYLGAAVVAGAETSEAVEPTQGAFGNPAEDAQSAAVRFVAPRQVRLNAAAAKFPTMWFAVVGAVGIDFIRSLARPTGFARDRRHVVEQVEQLGRIVAVGFCRLDVQGNPFGRR